MDLGEANNFNGIEEGVNHWLIKTMFNYLDEIIEFHNSKNITNVEYGCGTCNNIYHLLKRSKSPSIIKSIIGIDPTYIISKNLIGHQMQIVLLTVLYPLHTMQIL